MDMLHYMVSNSNVVNNITHSLVLSFVKHCRHAEQLTHYAYNALYIIIVQIVFFAVMLFKTTLLVVVNYRPKYWLLLKFSKTSDII